MIKKLKLSPEDRSPREHRSLRSGDSNPLSLRSVVCFVTSARALAVRLSFTRASACIVVTKASGITLPKRVCVLLQVGREDHEGSWIRSKKEAFRQKLMFVEPAELFPLAQVVSHLVRTSNGMLKLHANGINLTACAPFLHALTEFRHGRDSHSQRPDPSNEPKDANPR